jgi:hypothetical protein
LKRKRNKNVLVPCNPGAIRASEREPIRTDIETFIWQMRKKKKKTLRDQGGASSYCGNKSESIEYNLSTSGESRGGTV